MLEIQAMYAVESLGDKTLGFSSVEHEALGMSYFYFGALVHLNKKRLERGLADRLLNGFCFR